MKDPTFVLNDGATTPRCPYCRHYEHAGHALNCVVRFATKNQREHDLVRQMRFELHAEHLITNEEYAILASDHPAVARLEDYDSIRGKLDDLISCVRRVFFITHPGVLVSDDAVTKLLEAFERAGGKKP